MVKVTGALAGAVLFASTLIVAGVSAQGPPAAPSQAPPPSQTPPPQGRGGGGVFPAQQRPPGDAAIVARGKTIYGVTCTFCHGADLRGGQMNGPNLLRSQLVLGDQAGELIMPVIRGGRAEKGMPPIAMSDEDVKAVAEYIHSVAALSPRQGMPPPGETPVVLDVLVGDATAGRAYFDATCSACHSAAGDLQGIATRVPDPKALQNLWVSGGGTGGRGGRGAAAPSSRAVTATVTLPSGEKAEGRLLRMDDFIISLTQADGTVRSFGRAGAIPRVEIRDPLEPHRKLLPVYTNKNMHDVTAYLATLK